MTLVAKYDTKPTLGRCSVKFDLTEIIEKRKNDEYKLKEQINSKQFLVGEYTAHLSLYPAGDKEETKLYWAVFLCIKRKSNTASVTVSLKYDNGGHSKKFFSDPIELFGDGGRGYP
eukprot:165180_1